MADLIDFGRVATGVDRLERVDVVSVSIGIILAQFFNSIAIVIDATFDAVAAPIRGVGEFAGELVTALSGAQIQPVQAAFEVTAQAAAANPTIAFVVGIVIVLGILFLIAQVISSV